jgi:hypothetical protein
MSRMKPTASTTVNRAMQINAKNAALLRVMVESIAPRFAPAVGRWCDDGSACAVSARDGEAQAFSRPQS